MAAPPPTDPWYRNYWGQYNRPYSGCGCLYTLLMVLLIVMLCSLMFSGGSAWWYS